MILVIRQWFRIEEAHQSLVYHRFPNDFRIRKTTDPGDQGMGVTTCAIDQFGET